jgi:sulfur-carrier protein
MKVLFFANLEELAGHSAVEISGKKTLAELLQDVYNSYPAIQKQKFAVAVNRKIVHGDYELNDTDEIALLPPFSGG